MKNVKIPPGLQIWIEARRRYKLSDAHVQMARELGMNPKKLGGLANERQERWTQPRHLSMVFARKRNCGKRGVK